MKAWKRVWALLACACALLMLAGCQKASEPTTVPTETTAPQPQLTPREKYEQAREALENASNWILTYTLEERRTVGAETFLKTATGKASYSKLYSEDMMALVEETLSYGSFSSVYSEVYCEGTAYSQVNQSTFKADMDPQAFVQRQLPAVLLDLALYQTVVQSVDANGTVITFADAKGIEQWAEIENARFVSAGGTATLDTEGNLKETTCTVTYLVGKVEYCVSAAVQATAPAGLDLSGAHQEHIKGSRKIDSLDVPKMLLQIVGDVYAANKLQCSAVESVFSEAIPLAYSQSSEIRLTGRENSLNARVDYQIHLSDDRGNISTKTQTDAFENGVYTKTENNGKPQENKAITALQMRSYCEDLILSALAAPKYLREATLTKTKDSYRLEISGNLDFVKDMMANISQFLQLDLDAKATEAKTLSAGAYVVIDRETGLPTAMGLELEREHTIDTVPYLLTYRLEQTMELSEN